MSSIIKREESPETFLRTILRTSTLPPAEFSDTASMYKEEEVEPPVQLPNVFAQQYYASRESSISTNSAYQGSSPRKYRLDGRVSRDLFFPEYAKNQKNKAPSKALPTTAVDNDVYANMFTLPDIYESFLEQAPLPDVMPDGTFRTRSNSETVKDLVAGSQKMLLDYSSLALRVSQMELENITTRATLDQLTQGSMSAPGPKTRFRDAIDSRTSTPTTPTKDAYVPFRTFVVSNPGIQDEPTSGSKHVVGKSNKKQKPAKSQARKDLKVKIPGIKNPTVPLIMSGSQPDSGYLTGSLTPGFPSSPLTPGRIGPATPSKRGNGGTSVARRKNHVAKGKMPPPLIMVPQVPLTDTEIIVYMFQSLARPPVALRLYSRQWGPAMIVDVLNSHRDIEGGYLRNTCSVKCITAINRGKEKYGRDWAAQFRTAVATADDLVATDLIRYYAEEMDNVIDYDIRALGNGLKKHPAAGIDGGIFTRCVKYCIKYNAEYTLNNVHDLAWALQTGALVEAEEEEMAEATSKAAGETEQIVAEPAQKIIG